MKKMALWMGIIFFMMIVPICSAFADSSVTAVNGTVTIKKQIDAVSETPIALFILPQILEGENDITVDAVNNAKNNTTEFKALGIECADIIWLPENKIIEKSYQMKDSLRTGMCHVLISYIGSNGFYSICTFEHVGKNDVASLVKEFNDKSNIDYGSAIQNDIRTLEILRKSSANVVFYENLSAPDQYEFHRILYNKKIILGEFTITTLIETFNECCVWIRLRTDTDTLSVLKTYNSVYWQLPLSDGADFYRLSDDEKSKLLGVVKKGKYEQGQTLLNDFAESLAIAFFRTVTTREELEALIAGNGTYSAYFNGVRAILENTGLDQYGISLVYNTVLETNVSCNSILVAEKLFQDAVKARQDELKNKSGSDNGKPKSYSGGIGGKIVSDNSKTDVKQDQSIQPVKELPFLDVSADYWARPYIERFYNENVIKGVSEREFAPNDSVERQAFVKILIAALKIEPSLSDTTFTDLKTGCYFEPYIMAAVENGFITGISNTEFGMWTNVKREDVAVILSRVLDKYNVVVAENQTGFTDSSAISVYARNAATKMATTGIFKGDEQGVFNPKGSMSRAEACAVIYRVASKLKGE